MYQVISFYQYTHLADPEQLRDQLKEYCQNNQILGRILIGTEGLNGAVCGEKNQVEKFKQFLTQNPIFADLTFREQETETNAYHKLVIKVRQEICAFGAPVDVEKKKGIHPPPQQLKQWYEQNEDFMIVDARNEYEFAVGRFKNAVKLPIQNFREFPEQALKELAPHKEKKIVLYCTGGIRCEKASAYLKNTCSEECMNASRHRKVQNKADQKKIVGIVENYYSKAQVALIKTIHPLNIYSNISISGNTTKDVIQEVTEMRTYDGEEIPFAPEGSYITIPIKEKIRKNDKVALC